MTYMDNDDLGYEMTRQTWTDPERAAFRKLLRLVDGRRGYGEVLMAFNRIRSERRGLTGQKGNSNILPPGHSVMDIPEHLYRRYSPQSAEGGYTFMAVL